jgi:hypothetical protein
MEKWAKEEKERRLNEKGPLYQSTKPKRNIEGLKTFGYVQETEDVSKLHKNVVSDDIMGHMPSSKRALPSEISEKDMSIDSYFEGLNDDKFEDEFRKLSSKKEKAEAYRLRKEAEKMIKLTEADKEFKTLADIDSD